MKEGTGGDPFGDDPLGDDDSSEDPLGESSAADSEEAEPDGDGGTATDASDSVETTDADTEDSSRDTTGDAEDDGLPWAVERNSVKSDREMVQFYLRAFAQDRESEFQREVESETGYDTYLTDVREAAYLVAMNHPEEVAELLDDWGCEYV